MLKDKLARVCVCEQVNGHHADVAGSGGQPDHTGGGASHPGGAEGPTRTDRTAQDHPLLPLPQGALHRTQVSRCSHRATSQSETPP